MKKILALVFFAGAVAVIMTERTEFEKLSTKTKHS